MNTEPINTQPIRAGSPLPDPGGATSPTDWIATVRGLQERLPFLGSIANINRLLVMEGGLPFQRLKGRLLFHIPTVMCWVAKHPGRNLPAA